MSSWGDPDGSALPAAFRAVGSSSFIELISQVMPHTLGHLQHPHLKGSPLATANLTAASPAAQSLGAQPLGAQPLGVLAASAQTQIPHGTTVVAAICRGGVVMAGDRRATMGNLISQRDIEKVFPADQHCCVGIAGAAGIAVELVRLFQVELEHYEKIEGTQLSLDGKANRLSALLRANLGLALQGLAALPILAGYDLTARRGRIFGYDLTGGRNEESAFLCIGSGSMFARGSLKKLYTADLEPHRAAAVAIEALYDAADDDSATGGPDLSRNIFPSVAVVDCDGFRRLAEEEVSQLATEMVARRGQRPDGPLARLD